MKKLIGSISVALTLVLSVFGLAACDLVNFNWGTGSDHEHHFTEFEATDPTCTKNGNIRYFKCDVGPNPCGRYYIDLAAMEPVSEESVMIPALGHEYDFDNIVWSEWNGKEITASVTCTQCDEEEPGHVLHPEITVKFTQTKAPTCTAKGEGYYTASFTYEGETYTNPTTKTAEVDMIPHTYNKEPDDGWKWADDHTSVSATFTCTAADCTHTETVTVSGAAITSKVETIKGVCTDGSQTVYTATAEFNGETYDLTDTVVTRPAINEHKAGDWQYDTENHWHKCQNGDHAADEKQPHQVDSTTHKCECGYVEESYTVTTLTLAANAENTAAILTISGTYTGYDQQGLTELFCEKNTDGNYFFNFWGNRIGRENAKSVTLTKWENGEFSVALDVTDLPVCELRNICRTDLGDQDWKLSTETIEETTITVGEKVYTLQPSNGQGWNNIGLKVASKPDEKSYTITKMTIAADEGAQKVYLTISGTFAGYDEEGIKELLNFVKNGNKFFYFYENSAGAEAGESYDVSTSGSEWFVKIDVTKLGPSEYRNICCTGIDGGDMKPDNFPGVVVENTLTVGEKIYTLGNNLWGNIGLTIKAKQIEVDGTFDLTTVTLEVDETAVYVVYKGTHTCKDTAALQAKFEAEAFGIWVGKLIPEANRTVTVEATTWTIKANVSSMNLADGTHFIYFNGGSGAGDINTFPLEAIPNITKTFGEKDYSIENHYGEASDNPHFWGCVILRIAPTKEVSTYDFTDVTIEKTDSTVYFVASGSHNYTNTEELKTALNAIKFAFGDKTDNTELEKKIEVTDGSWSIKFNVTELAAQANPYYFHFFYSDDPEGDVRLKNEHAEDGKFVELAGKKYSIVNKGNGVNTWANETFYGCVCLKVETAKTATFADADLLTIDIEGKQRVRVLLRITATGFTDDELAKENVKLVVGETEIPSNESYDDGGRYYFLLPQEMAKGTYTLKVTIGGMEFDKNLATSVTEVNSKQFLNPNFYTLALNGDDLVLTVINAAEAFTLNGISLKNTDGTVNLTLTGTTTAADATAKLFLENYGYCYYKNGRQQFVNKTVTVEGGEFTFTVNVTDLGAGSYTLLARDADTTDLTNSDISLESITDKEATKDSINYSIVNVEGTKLALLIEDSAHACDYTSITLEKTGEQVYLVLGGTYDGYSKEEVEALLKNTDGGKMYSIGFWPNVIPAEDRTITVNDSEKTWTLKFEITDLNAGAHNFCIQMVGGGDAKGPAGFVQQTETVGDTTFTLQGGVGANISVKVEKKDPDAQTGTVAYTSVTLETTAEKVYLVYRGTYTGFTAEYLKETVLKNTDTSKEDIPSFGFYKGDFNKATPAEITVTEEGLTWEVKIDITDFSGNYSVLWQNKNGGDAHGPEGFVEQSEAFNGNTYSLTGSVGGDIHLKVEEGIHGTYEVTSGSVELEGGKAYFSVNGTYKNYEEDGLKAALETVEFWFTRYGDYPEIGQGTSEKRTPFTTEPEISVDTEAKTWKVSVDVTNFENGTWIAKFPGDIKLAGSQDGQSVTVGDKTYSIFNKYPDGSEQPSIWGCTCLLVEDALKENEINFGGESVSTVHPDHMFYWNGDTEGTNATVTTKTAVDGVYTFQYTLTETAKGNAGLWYAVQLFYKNSELKENTVYTLTFQLKSSVTGKITVNGTVIDLTGSNQVQAVSVEYTQNAKASLSIQFGVDDGSNEKKGSHIDGGEFVISDLKWQEKTSGPEEPPAEKSVTFAGTDFMMYGDKDIQLALNLASIQGYDKETDLAVSNIKLIVGTLEIPCREYPGAIYFTLTTAGTSIADLADESYEVKLKIGTDVYVCPTNLQGQIGKQLSLNGKTYTLAVVDGKLILTVATSTTPVDKEINFTVVSINADNGNLRIFFNYTKQGYSEGELTKDNFKLYVGEKEIDCSELAADAMHFVFAVDDLSDSSYTVVIKLNGEEVAFGTMTVNSALTSIELNGKTFTLATTGDTDKKLTLTVAAVVPAADGSQDAPFSVSDLAAIFNNAENLNEDGYYEKDGVVPKVYVKGMVTNAEAISEITGKNAGKGYYKIWIKAISTSEIALAADFGPDTEFVIFQAFWNDTMQQGMKFQNGDIIIVSGYLQKYTSQQGDTTYEITYYNNENPAIETWESVNEGNKGADAELEMAALKEFFEGTVSEGKQWEAGTYDLPKPTRPSNVKFKFEVPETYQASLTLDLEANKFTVIQTSAEVSALIKVTITVGTQDFAPVGEGYTLKIAKDTTSGTYSITAKYDPAVRGYTSGNSLKASEKAKDVTITFASNGGTTPAYYTEARIYNKNTMTLSLAEGHFTQIKLSLDKAVTASVGTLSTLSNKTMTWTGEAQTVVFKASETTKITLIDIIYLSPNPECTHEALTKHEGKAPTCTEAGTAEYWTCDNCERMFSVSENPADEDEIFFEQPVNETGHTYQYEDNNDGKTHKVTCSQGDLPENSEPHQMGSEGNCAKCGGAITAEKKEVELTLTLDDSWATASSATEKTIEKDDITIGYINVYSAKSNNVKFLQMGSKKGEIYNKTAFPGKIVKIEVTVCQSPGGNSWAKTATMKCYFGESQKPSGGEISENHSSSSATITFENTGDNNTYFYLKNTAGAWFVESIKVIYESLV